MRVRLAQFEALWCIGSMHIGILDYSIIALYFAFVLTIGFLLKKQVKNASDFLHNRNLPLWITSIAFISANLGAQEVIGMAASGAKYGIMTSHFYWVGAIPAMVFLGLFMMPFYYGSRARSVPEYLSLRFDEKTRGLNAITFAIMTVFSSGISLYGLALLFEILLGWNFTFSILVAAGIVMVYTFTGGLTSAIYNEVLQFFLIVLGLVPLVVIGLYRVGGIEGLTSHLDANMLQSWRPAVDAATSPMGANVWQIVLGLGFVLSFGYWCTDFLVVQRAMVAKNMRDAQRTPIVAAFPKMFLPFVVIVPGLIAVALSNMGGDYVLPLKADGRVNFDMTLPSLLTTFYPTGLLGVGLTALMASFMSGMAGNVTAFNSVWTYDIYQAYINKDASDKHYLGVARFANVFGILISVGTAYLATQFNNIMDFLQLVFGFINAPLFATFLLGMFWKRTTGHGAFWGLLAGTVAAGAFHGSTGAEGKQAWILGQPLIEFHSAMGQALTIAIVAWTACFIVTIVVSVLTKPRPENELRGLVYSLTDKPHEEASHWYTQPLFLGALALAIVIVLNFVFA
jgi:solute:Na+ symporter, SSS family